MDSAIANRNLWGWKNTFFRRQACTLIWIAVSIKVWCIRLSFAFYSYLRVCHRAAARVVPREISSLLSKYRGFLRTSFAMCACTICHTPVRVHKSVPGFARKCISELVAVPCWSEDRGRFVSLVPRARNHYVEAFFHTACHTSVSYMPRTVIAVAELMLPKRVTLFRHPFSTQEISLQISLYLISVYSQINRSTNANQFSHQFVNKQEHVRSLKKLRTHWFNKAYYR